VIKVSGAYMRGSCICAALALAALTGQRAALAENLHLDPAAFKALGHTDERFQSYNVEMAEVIGGRFWKPYAHMDRSHPPAGELQVGRDPDRFEVRPPVDLSNRRLRLLAAALGPAYVRVSGTWANSVYFQNDDAPAMPNPPDGFGGVLTRAQWKGVIDFANAVDAQIVTSFTISPGVRDASGTWTPVEAKPLLEFTHSVGGKIFAAELFNEPNLPSYGAAPKNYDSHWFARDEAAFRAFVAKTAPGMLIAGPGDVAMANQPAAETRPASRPNQTPSAPVQLKPEDLLAADPPAHFDIFSYHFYPAVSQRCAPAGSAIGTSPKQALSEEWLARTDQPFDAHMRLRDHYAAGAPIWLTETAEAACGGNPWAASFIDSFRYLDQMGRLAKRGAGAIFHNTLAASDYGLIDQTTLEPRPNYWAALLWRRLMGPVVLDAGPMRPSVHLYAQCLRDRPGGVALLVLNMSGAAVTLEIPEPADAYVMTSTSLRGQTVLLNGSSLSLGSSDRIPELNAQSFSAGHVKLLPPNSIDFIAVPRAQNPGCH
jgi:heparanase 1